MKAKVLAVVAALASLFFLARPASAYRVATPTDEFSLEFDDAKFCMLFPADATPACEGVDPSRTAALVRAQAAGKEPLALANLRSDTPESGLVVLVLRWSSEDAEFGLDPINETVARDFAKGIREGVQKTPNAPFTFAEPAVRMLKHNEHDVGQIDFDVVRTDATGKDAIVGRSRMLLVTAGKNRYILNFTARGHAMDELETSTGALLDKMQAKRAEQADPFKQGEKAGKTYSLVIMFGAAVLAVAGYLLWLRRDRARRDALAAAMPRKPPRQRPMRRGSQDRDEDSPVSSDDDDRP
ncbi:MAG: hypothetical protein U0271_21765 [Polyangiaceae bacterium]